ncbi:MAG TPA: hypothetical protein PLX59_06105, partial [Candidatus Cloacimonadota bacterium]|nr:hypothetical protein [Candidatus Cloacimonadota bacterium]
MKHIITKTFCVAILLTGATGLSALGEVRTGMMNVAEPRNGVRCFYSNGFQSNLVKDYSDDLGSSISESVGGGVASLRLSPRTEASFWVSHYGKSTCVELQGKYLLSSTDEYDISIGFGAYNSEGVKKERANNVNYVKEKCVVNGLTIPIIYSMNTNLHVLLSFGAAVNYDWVTVSGADKVYDSDTHQWSIHKFEYDPVGVLRGQCNFSMEANTGGIAVMLENGISFV